MSSDLHTYSLSRNLAGISGFGYRENIQDRQERRCVQSLIWANQRVDVAAAGPRIALPLSETFILGKLGVAPVPSIL
ncbi:MAG: hypothetical protein ACK4N1_06410 [Pseudorhizobium sp.]